MKHIQLFISVLLLMSMNDPHADRAYSVRIVPKPAVLAFTDHSRLDIAVDGAATCQLASGHMISDEAASTEALWDFKNGKPYMMLSEENNIRQRQNVKTESGIRTDNVLILRMNMADPLVLAEKENEQLMNDFNAMPTRILTEEENDRLMNDFNTMPMIARSKTENDRLMNDFNALPNPKPVESVETGNPHAASGIVWTKEENDRLVQDFNTMSEVISNDGAANLQAQGGFIEGHVYLLSTDDRILPAKGIWVNAWSDELNTGDRSLTDETGRYIIRVFKEVNADKAETRGYLVEVDTDGYAYQVYDQTDIRDDSTWVGTGRADIDFYLEPDFTI